MAIVAERKTIPAGGGAFIKPWTRDELYNLYDLGLIDPQEPRTELIAGEIFQKMPHAACAELVSDALRGVFRNIALVRSEHPLVLATDGEPEPYVAVVRGTIRTYEKHHPTQDDTLLVVEVSDTTLRFDRGRKGAYYAEAAIPEYWIVNLSDRQVEVYRNPHPDAQSEWGFAYDAPIIVGESDTVSPLALPGTVLHVADLLPAA